MMMASTGPSLWCLCCLFCVISSAILPGIDASRSDQCPSACYCLGDMVDCSKRGLKEIPADIPHWVSFLDLTDNELTSIPPNTFTGLSKLQELDLSTNQFTGFNSSAFNHLPSLTKLKLSYNQLQSIPVLETGSNLTQLILTHNEIKAVVARPLSLLPNLRMLDLGYNDLRNLTNTSFPVMPTLHLLYLNNNKIKHIEQRALNNLSSLEWLKLNRNKLKHFAKDVFTRLNKLKYLELMRNRFQEIEGLSFQGLDNLISLKLKRNNIQSLFDGALWGLSSIQTLELDHNNISAITKGWLYGMASLQKLSLSHNRISRVEESVWDFCSQLRELDLTHNEVSVIEEKTFGQLPSLQHMHLEYNKVSYIAPGAFRDMSSLQSLDLNHNEISWTIEDMNGAFEGLQELSRLALENNHIKSIAKRAFEGLDHLKQLHLAHNPIASIQDNAFQPIQSLQELKLNTTNLVCDCHLAWLPVWLTAAGFQNTINARCIHPEALVAKSIFQVERDDFVCSDSPKPEMELHPSALAALKGANASLSCKASSSSDSPLLVEWRKNLILLRDAVVENFASAKQDGSSTEILSVLHIEEVQDADGGIYQCVVSNRLGTTYSAKAQVTVHIYPSFLKTPEDVTVRAGTTARLDCAATGQPQPEVAWQKDGGDDFPAARERRMHVMPEDDVFFIVNVQSEDQGVYSCTAKNNVGTVIANATLKVLEMPAFVKPMENKATAVGKTTVLECMASGSPRPRLHWTKDGQPLEATPRHFFTAENQLLIIVQTEVSDAGTYACEMANTLGMARGKSQLKIYNGDFSEVLGPVPGDADGQGSEAGSEPDSTTTGIIIIAVVCCVVGTSLVWVIIIYKTRKKTEEYSSTPTDETTLPGDVPGTPFHSSDTNSNSSPGMLAASFGRYPIMEVNKGFGFSPSCIRTAAIFPSDVEDDDHRQAIPLTSDEQQFAETSDTSLNLLRRLRNASESDTVSSSPRSSVHSARSNGLLQTFHPTASLQHLQQQQQHRSSLQNCSQHAPTHAPQPNASLHRHHPQVTVVEVQPQGPRSAYMLKGDSDAGTPDGYHGALPPGQEQNDDVVVAMEPTSLPRAPAPPPPPPVRAAQTQPQHQHHHHHPHHHHHHATFPQPSHSVHSSSLHPQHHHHQQQQQQQQPSSSLPKDSSSSSIKSLPANLPPPSHSPVDFPTISYLPPPPVHHTHKDRSRSRSTSPTSAESSSSSSSTSHPSNHEQMDSSSGVPVIHSVVDSLGVVRGAGGCCSQAAKDCDSDDDALSSSGHHACSQPPAGIHSHHRSQSAGERFQISGNSGAPCSLQLQPIIPRQTSNLHLTEAQSPGDHCDR